MLKAELLLLVLTAFSVLRRHAALLLVLFLAGSAAINLSAAEEKKTAAVFVSAVINQKIVILPQTLKTALEKSLSAAGYEIAVGEEQFPEAVYKSADNMIRQLLRLKKPAFTEAVTAFMQIKGPIVRMAGKKIRILKYEGVLTLKVLNLKSRRITFSKQFADKSGLAVNISRPENHLEEKTLQKLLDSISLMAAKNLDAYLKPVEPVKPHKKKK